jgi:ribosomal protein S18 acetylase RimI-like enzyme
MQTIYNHPYYPDHLEKLGYRKEVDWVEYEIRVPDPIHEKLQRMAQIVARKNNLKAASIKKPKDLLPYAKDLFGVLNSAYENLFGVVPLTQRQIDNYVKEYLGFVHPEFVSIILDAENRVAAFAISVPSLSRALQKAHGRLFPFGLFHLLRARKKNDTADLCVIGVRPELQGKGVNAMIMHELNKTFLKHNILKAESNPELETNTQVQGQWKFFETTQHKRRRCFIKNI